MKGYAENLMGGYGSTWDVSYGDNGREESTLTPTVKRGLSDSRAGSSAFNGKAFGGIAGYHIGTMSRENVTL